MWQRTSLVTAGLALAMLAITPRYVVRADEGGSNRPIKGTAQGSVTGVAPSGALVVDYTGIASHLGNFTRREYVFFGPDNTIFGCMVVKAANGDELRLDFSGGFISQTTAVGTYTFTGGTGRFTNATGTASFEAVTPDLVHVTASFEGLISY